MTFRELADAIGAKKGQFLRESWNFLSLQEVGMDFDDPRLDQELF